LTPLPSSIPLAPYPSSPPIYTLSLHDALPISGLNRKRKKFTFSVVFGHGLSRRSHRRFISLLLNSGTQKEHTLVKLKRSEEHTSELQSRFDLVCRLLLEKKKKRKKQRRKNNNNKTRE